MKTPLLWHNQAATCVRLLELVELPNASSPDPPERAVLLNLIELNALLGTVKNTFRKITANGWDTDSALRWGFFFIDKDKDKLLNVFTELEEHSYSIEELHQADDGD